MLRDMQREVAEFCEAKGWREEPIAWGEAMALLHTEIAEASDAWRRWGTKDATEPDRSIHLQLARQEDPAVLPKPEGVGSEFADVFIRLLDDADLWGWDLEAAANQAGLFGLYDTFLENTNALHTLVGRLSSAGDGAAIFGGAEELAGAVLVLLRQLSECYGIDLLAEYERKMAYNRTRPYKHGGKRR